MALVFTSEIHRESFNRVQGRTDRKGLKTALYLLTSFPRLAYNIEDYLTEHGLDVEKLMNLRLSSGERAVVALALNIYNGYLSDEVSLNPYELFGCLDEEYRNVVVKALEFRFVA